LKFPTPEHEHADPTHADAVYESVTAWLLAQTRDTQKFGLLFRENISYGFRRNLWGMKPIGIAIALGAAVVSTAVIVYQHVKVGSPLSFEVVSLTALAWILVVIWIFVVTRSWVRVPADAYGRQLLAACDVLSRGQGIKKR